MTNRKMLEIVRRKYPAFQAPKGHFWADTFLPFTRAERVRAWRYEIECATGRRGWRSRARKEQARKELLYTVRTSALPTAMWWERREAIAASVSPWWGQRFLAEGRHIGRYRWVGETLHQCEQRPALNA